MDTGGLNLFTMEVIGVVILGAVLAWAVTAAVIGPAPAGGPR